MVCRCQGILFQTLVSLSLFLFPQKNCYYFSVHLAQLHDGNTAGALLLTPDIFPWVIKLSDSFSWAIQNNTGYINPRENTYCKKQDYLIIHCISIFCFSTNGDMSSSQLWMSLLSISQLRFGLDFSDSGKCVCVRAPVRTCVCVWAELETFRKRLRRSRGNRGWVLGKLEVNFL